MFPGRYLVAGVTDIIVDNGGCPYCGCTCSGQGTGCTVDWPTSNYYVISSVDEMEMLRIEPLRLRERPAWLVEQRRVPQASPPVAFRPGRRAYQRRHIRPPSGVRKPTAAHRMGLRDARP